MQKFHYLILLCAFVTACAHQEKHAETPEVIPPPPDVKIENLNLNSARVGMKSINHKKLLGILHLAQYDSNIRAEVQIEGLKSGPYELHLSKNSNCKKINLKTHHDLAQVIADKNGVIKTTVDFTNVLTQDLVGKTLILHTKSKKSPKAIACGVIEKN